MSKSALSAVVARVRRAALALPADPSLSDSRLLGRFVAARDEQAFAALVYRHGPMVRSVCRRVAGDVHLADDAFQAAFLVLARRAADVKPRAAVRAWLYGVAVRTAREARTMAARRRVREVPLSILPDRPAPAEPPADAEALRMLHEEVARLPDHLRSAVVLCELDGLSRKDAAARLAIPAGTLSSRLAKARAVLARRLRGRGVVLGAAGWAALCGQATSASSLPEALAAAAVRVARPTPVSLTVAELARGVLRTMFLNKVTRAIALVTLTAIVGGASAWSFLGHVQADLPPAAPAAAAKAEPTRPAVPGRILFQRDGKLYLISPDGTNERAVDLPPAAAPVACLSPDGRSLAFWAEGDKENAGKPTVCVRTLDGNGLGTQIPLGEPASFIQFFWSRDGKELHVNLGGPPNAEVRHFLVDVKTRTATKLNMLKHHLVSDVTPDGKHLLATGVGDGADWQPKSIHLMKRDGTEHLTLAELQEWGFAGKLSPDGKRALCSNAGKPCVIDLDKPRVLHPVEGIPAEAQVVQFAWSPDGKKIVYTVGATNVLSPEELKKVESRLVVADPDGKNAKVLASAKGQLILGVDWR